MNIYEVDFSLPWIRDIFRGLKTAVEDISNRLEEVDWFDGVWANEHLEEVLGVVGTLSQTYINRTWADLGKMGMSRSSDLKWRLMHDHARKLKAHPEVSAVELLYHLANYWKHRDNWPNWCPECNRKRTILALGSVDITEETEFRCVRGMEKINPSVDCLFDDVLDVLKSWRKSVVEYHLAKNSGGHDTQLFTRGKVDSRQTVNGKRPTKRRQSLGLPLNRVWRI